MEWGDLRIFLAIAREGTLGAAARKLGQSQPTMGRRLRALEQAVGQTLFQRTGEGFVLTDEGAGVLSHAERMEDEALALERQLAGQDQHFDGLLRLSSSDWFGARILTPVFAEFARMQPHVVVELITGVSHHSLARREADIVFKNRPFDEPEAVSRRLMRRGAGRHRDEEAGRAVRRGCAHGLGAGVDGAGAADRLIRRRRGTAPATAKARRPKAKGRVYRGRPPAQPGMREDDPAKSPPAPFQDRS